MAEVGTITARFTADTRQFEEGLKRSTQRLRQFGDQTAKIGRDLTTKLTLPLSIIGTLSVRSFANFDFAMRRVAAVSGATGKQFEQLTKLAKDLGRTTEFTAKQSAEAMGALSIAGFTTVETMKALPGVLQLAAAAAVDLGTAADAAAKVLKGYGFQVEQISRVNDVLVKTFTSTNTTLGTLVESFKLVAPIASVAGLRFEEMAAAIGILGDKGFQGSLSGTALRKAISSLVGPANEAKDLMEDLGISVTTATGKMLPLTNIIEQLEGATKQLGGEAEIAATFMTLFGERAGPAMAALVQSGSKSLAELTKNLINAGGTAEIVRNTQMAGITKTLKELESAIEGAALAFGESLVPAVTKVGGFIRDLAVSFASLDSSTQGLVATFAITAAAAGPLFIAVAALVKVFAGLGSLLLPGGLIVVGVGLLIAGFFKLSTHLKTVKTNAELAATALKDLSKEQTKLEFGRLIEERFKLSEKIAKVQKALAEFPGMQRQFASEKLLNSLLEKRAIITQRLKDLRTESSRRFLKAVSEEEKSQKGVTASVGGTTKALKGMAELLKKIEEDSRELILQARGETNEDIVALEKQLTKELSTEGENRLRAIREEMERRLDLIEAAIAFESLTEEEAAEKRIKVRESALKKTSDLLKEQTEEQKRALEKLGDVSINVSKTISEAVGKAFEGVVLGTSKLADVGKNLFNSLLGSVTKFFTDAITQKLGFENIIFSNLRGFIPAANSAIAAGGVSTSGGNGILGAIFGGGGGGGGGGGLLSGLGSAASGIGNFFGGITGAALGGFGLGGLVGGGGIASNIGGALGGAAGSALGSIPFIAASTLVPSLAGTALGAGTVGLSTAITSAVSGALGSTIGGLAGNLILPGIGAIAGGLLGKLLGGLFSGKVKKPAFQFAVTLPQGEGLTIGSVLGAAQGGLKLIGQPGVGASLAGSGGGLVLSTSGTSAALPAAAAAAPQINAELQRILAPFVQVLESVSPKNRARLLATPVDFSQFPSAGTLVNNRDLPGQGVFGASGGFPVNFGNIPSNFASFMFSSSRDIQQATTTGIEHLTNQLTAAFQATGIDPTNPAEIAKLQAEQLKLQQEAAEELQRLALEAQIAEQFRAQTLSLERQITLIGKSTEEAAKLRLEFELADLAVQGFNDSQISSLKSLAEQRDKAIFQLERENQLEVERLQRLQRFESLAESIGREIEEGAFRIDTFGKNLEETLAARRTLELSRLAAEGVSPMELDLLSGLMRERDKLALDLDELQNPGPTNIEITINGNINDQEDVRDLARRLGVIITAQVAPFSN